MEPIHELMNRIRWDPLFGAADFSMGYYDRHNRSVTVVALAKVHFATGDHFAIDVVDSSGVTHYVPLHRVRDVYRNGDLIWHRDAER